MVELVWLDSHVGSIGTCLTYANRFLWNLSTFRGADDRWYVKSGETVIFVSDEEESRDSFLYGIGLAYAGVPEDLLAQLESELRDRFT